MGIITLRKIYQEGNKENQMIVMKGAADFKRSLRVPQRGQHSPSGTVALAHGIRGQETSRHTVAEFWTGEQSN